MQLPPCTPDPPRLYLPTSPMIDDTLRHYSIWQIHCFWMGLLLREMQAKGLAYLRLAHLMLDHHTERIHLGFQTLLDLQITLDMQRVQSIVSCHTLAHLVETYSMGLIQSFKVMGYSNMQFKLVLHIVYYFLYHSFLLFHKLFLF